MCGVVAREYVPQAWEKGGDVARVWVGMEVGWGR
jgi:hypothetical protein